MVWRACSDGIITLRTSSLELQAVSLCGVLLFLTRSHSVSWNLPQFDRRVDSKLPKRSFHRVRVGGRVRDSGQCSQHLFSDPLASADSDHCQRSGNRRSISVCVCKRLCRALVLCQAVNRPSVCMYYTIASRQ